VGCYALFQHLTVGVQAANAIYHQAREGVEALRGALTLDSDKHADATLDPGAASKEAGALCAKRLAAECEALAVQQTALLKYHLSTSVFPLATLRHALTSSLSALPHSAPLWTLYIQVRSGRPPSFPSEYQPKLVSYTNNSARCIRLSGGEPVSQRRTGTPLLLLRDPGMQGRRATPLCYCCRATEEAAGGHQSAVRAAEPVVTFWEPTVW